MDLQLTSDHDAFREEVRQFLDANWVGVPGERRRSTGYVREFRLAATNAGYLYRGVPRKYGGSEQPVDVIRLHLIRQEFARVRAPREQAGNGVNNLVPTLIEHGAEWQREQFVPKTLTGEYLWCQGYSEPGAGSDLASLRTSARLDGDEWVIDGHKIWTSYAAEAQYMYLLTRTELDRPRHSNLSYLLVDMTSPGITIRPLRQITGESGFNEVLLEGVRVPSTWIVGARGDGWKISKSTLRHERDSLGSSVRSEAMFASLVRLAQETTLRGTPALMDPVIRDRIVAVEAKVAAQRWSGYLQLTRAAAGRPPGRLGLTNKLMSTVVHHELAAIAQLILGDHALRAFDGTQPGPERWYGQIFGSLGFSIAGGTSNIQRNIVAERGLGLPRSSGAPS